MPGTKLVARVAAAAWNASRPPRPRRCRRAGRGRPPGAHRARGPRPSRCAIRSRTPGPPPRPTCCPHRLGGRSRPVHGSQRGSRRDGRRGLGPRPGRAQRVPTPPYPFDPHHRDRAPGPKVDPAPTPAADRAAGRPRRRSGSRPDRPWSRSPAPARTRRARRSPPCPTSPVRHYDLVPPGASVSCPQHHESRGSRPVLRPRLKIVFYSGAPRSGTKSRITERRRWSRRDVPDHHAGRSRNPMCAWR